MSIENRSTSLLKTKTPSLRWLFGMIVIATGLILLSGHTFLEERKIDLVVECIDGQATIAVNGRVRLTFDTPPSVGNSIGFYQWHAPPFGRKQTTFRDLRVERLDKPGDETVLSLSDPEHLDHFETIAPGGLPSDGDTPGRWHSKKRRGLSSTATRPGMAIALLKGFSARNFRMSVTMLEPGDAGIVFHARNPHNGTVFVVRPPCNDMYIFAMENGVAGPLKHLTPFRDLKAGEEALRLAGLLAAILLKTCCIILAFQFVTRFVPQPANPLNIRLPSMIRSPLAFNWVVFATTFTALAWVANASLDRIPHITDEVAYLFQAKIFAAGRLWADVPRIPEFFAHYHLMEEGGRWFSKYPPMYSTILALGVWAKCPWLVNPALGAALAVVTVVLARDLAGPKCAVLSWAMIIASPMFLFLGASMMNHVTTALFISLSLLLTMRGLHNRRRWVLLLAGMSWGASMLTRPFTAVVVFIPMIIYVARVWWKSSDRKETGRLLVTWPIGAFPLLVLFAGWMLVYCNEQGFPMIPNIGYHGTDSLGFGADKGEGWLMTWGTWGHTPAKAIRSVFAYLDNTSHYLQGWPFGLSLAFVTIPLLNRRRISAEMTLLYGAFLSLVIGHMFYWSTNHLGYGARYWFSGVPGLIILSAIGIDLLLPKSTHSPDSPGDRAPLSRGSVFVGALIGLLIFWNLSVYLPQRMFEGHTYGGVTAALEREVTQRELDSAIIFVKTEDSLYNDGFYLNDPFLRSGLIFVRDLGPRNQSLLNVYPRSQAFTWDRTMLKPLGPLPSSPQEP